MSKYDALTKDSIFEEFGNTVAPELFPELSGIAVEKSAVAGVANGTGPTLDDLIPPGKWGKLYLELDEKDDFVPFLSVTDIGLSVSKRRPMVAYASAGVFDYPIEFMQAGAPQPLTVKAKTGAQLDIRGYLTDRALLAPMINFAFDELRNYRVSRRFKLVDGDCTYHFDAIFVSEQCTTSENSSVRRYSIGLLVEESDMPSIRKMVEDKRRRP